MATNNSINLAEGLLGQLVTNTGSGFDNTTATYPSVATTTGTLLRADGTNWVATTATYPATTTINQILYSSANNVIGEISTVNGGVLVTNNLGVPSMLANPAAAGRALLSGNAAIAAWSTPTYPSASGSTGKILRSDGTNNVYSTSIFADTYTASNLLYSNGANTVTGLATANDGVLVTSGTGVPSIAAAIIASNLLPLGNSGVTAITSTTYDLSTASGTKTITGLAFRPSLVIFLASVAGAGTTVATVGYDNGTNAFSISKIDTKWQTSTANSIVMTTTAGNNQGGHITSFTADGFVITFTKTGTPTGTATIGFLAIK